MKFHLLCGCGEVASLRYGIICQVQLNPNLSNMIIYLPQVLESDIPFSANNNILSQQNTYTTPCLMALHPVH